MRIAISGTSGVGKTYLENILADKYNFKQLPKTTDRKQRPHEREGQGIYFKTREQIEKEISKYFFTLEYAGHIYAWSKSDLNTNKDCTIAITMESMNSLLARDLNFTPILLYIDSSNLGFLEQRIKNQLNFDSLNRQDKLEAEAKIAERLILAESELQNIDSYISIVESVKNGKAFQIQNDNTIFQEILPYIESLIQNEPRA